jgi:magnesium transporter
LAVIGFARIELWQAMADHHWTVLGLELGHNYDVTMVNELPVFHAGQHDLLALTVAISLVGVVLFGTLVGSMLPFIFRGLGFDPASASAPFIATFVDFTGLIIYFNVALHILLR